MSEPETRPKPAAPEWIDLARADDLLDVVHRAVACLAQGGLVALPTETTYIVAASALQPAAVEALWSLKGRRRPLPLGLVAAGAVPDWVPGLSAVGRRLAQRAWPGPVTFVFEGGVAAGLARQLPPAVRAIVAPEDSIALRVPGHDVVREILRRTPGPLVLSGAASLAGKGAIRPQELFAGHVELAMVLDDGPVPSPLPTTVVAVDAEGWRVVRPGAVAEADLERMAGTVILFVCTGNTCRSPMAEALCKLQLAARLGCRADELPDRGYHVLSAGLAASRGAPAAGDAREVVEGLGGTLDDHASQPVTDTLIEQSDWIIPMTRDHRDAILDYHPEAGERTHLLDPAGGDIDDPIGCGREVYRRTAAAIRRGIDELLDTMGLA